MTDTWDEEDSFTCPICHVPVLTATGPKNALILLVSSEPTDTEINDGSVFVGPSAGILRNEMAFCDIDLRSCRRMSLWPHQQAKSTKNNTNARCLQHGTEQVIKESIGRQIVVLFGADPVKVFVEQNVSAMSGLAAQSKYFSAVAFPCVAPGNVFQGGIGELRFAMRELQKLIKQLGLDAPQEKKGTKSSIIIEEVEEW